MGLTHGALGVVDPVGSEEAAEGGDEDEAAVVLNALSEVADFLGLVLVSASAWKVGVRDGNLRRARSPCCS